MKNIDKIKICIWMNFPSHHQSAFFSALDSDASIDLIVRYLHQVTVTRINIGWESHPPQKAYEKTVNHNINSTLTDMTDWKERIHILSPFLDHYLKALVSLFIDEDIKWVHWSERSGIKLQRMFYFNKTLTKFFHNLSLYHSGRKSYAKLVNQHALGVFAIGESARKDFLKWGIRKDKIEYLFYATKGIGQHNPPQKSKSIENIIKFGYVGELSKGKGIDLLLKAFAKLESKSEIKLYLIGPDLSKGNYKKIISRMGFDRDIIFTGSVKSDKITYYYKKFDILIMPSRFDGWGVVLNEAASMGKALIATEQCGAAWHLINHKKNGFLVKSHSIRALKNAMQFYINNPDIIKTHGIKSEKIFKHHTPEQNVIQLISAIKKWSSKQADSSYK